MKFTIWKKLNVDHNDKPLLYSIRKKVIKYSVFSLLLLLIYFATLVFSFNEVKLVDYGLLIGFCMLLLSLNLATIFCVIKQITLNKKFFYAGIIGFVSIGIYMTFFSTIISQNYVVSWINLIIVPMAALIMGDIINYLEEYNLQLTLHDKNHESWHCPTCRTDNELHDAVNIATVKCQHCGTESKWKIHQGN